MSHFVSRRCDRTLGPITRLWGSLWAQLSLREGGENRTRTDRNTRLASRSIIPFMDHLTTARTEPERGSISSPTTTELGSTARRLVLASVSPNTRESYTRALRQFDTWRGHRPLDDSTLAAYLAALYDLGRSPSVAALAVAAVRFRARLSDHPDPAGNATGRVLAGFRRTAADRGRGRADAFTADHLSAVLATCHRPRTSRRGIEAPPAAARRGRLDAVIAGLLFMAGLRRSEVAALRWSDVTDADAPTPGILVRVRTSKTNPAGETTDLRYVKNGVADALCSLRAETQPETSDRVVPLTPRSLARRFIAAAEAAGIDRRITAHSGRIGLASELTRRGASTTDVMLAGNWRTARMVAHYSAGATAEHGAVARYL